MAVVILVVEDNDIIRESVAEMLEEGGYTVVQSSLAEGAFHIMEQCAAELGGVVTDVNLGQGQPNGWEVARRARELSANIPILYMSGDSAHEWHAQGVPHSVMLQKPFAPADLVVALAGLRKID